MHKRGREMSELAFEVKRLRREDIAKDPRSGFWVHAGDYNMILRQRDEGLAREAELQAVLASAKAEEEAYGHNAVALRLRVNQLKQRLAEAEKLLSDMVRGTGSSPGANKRYGEIRAFLASPGCADGEQSIRLPSGGGKYAATLEPFATMMARELHANASKGDRPGWLKMTPGDCLLEIYYHVAKLQKAVRDKDSERVAENTADVANLAMMMADIWGLLDCCADAEKTP
jgi:hypothetical protein